MAKKKIVKPKVVTPDQETIQKIASMLLVNPTNPAKPGTMFCFQRADGTRAVTLKTSFRRGGFTVGLDDLTPEKAAGIAEGVRNVLEFLASGSEEAKQYFEKHMKVFSD